MLKPRTIIIIIFLLNEIVKNKLCILFKMNKSICFNSTKVSQVYKA